MPKRIFAIALLAGGIGCMAAAWAADDDEKTAGELNEARLSLAKRGFVLSLDAYEKRQRDDINNIATWSKRAVEIVRAGNDKAKLQQSLNEHRGRMLRLNGAVAAMQRAGEKAEIDKIEADYLLLEADSWLAEAKAANP